MEFVIIGIIKFNVLLQLTGKESKTVVTVHVSNCLDSSYNLLPTT